MRSGMLHERTVWEGSAGAKGGGGKGGMILLVWRRVPQYWREQKGDKPDVQVTDLV